MISPAQLINFRSWFLRIFCMLLLMMFIWSCSPPRRTITKVAGKTLEVKVCRVVLLPFVNESRSPQLSTQAYRIFLSEIVQSKLFQIEPEGDLRHFLYRNRVRTDTIWNNQLYALLAQQLGVDAVIVAYIRDSNLVAGASGSRNAFVSLQVELHEAHSGRLLLSSFLRRTGDDYAKVLHFGVVDTVSGLLQRMFLEIISEWQEKGVSGCH